MKKIYKKTVYLGLLVTVAMSFFVFPKTSMAANFYVDPVNGSMENDGSKENPWSTMQEVWSSGKIQTQVFATPYDPDNEILINKNDGAPVKPSDVIYLSAGYHGNLSISGAINSSPITIRAADGEVPIFGNIYLRSAKNWVFDGVLISPSYADVYSTEPMFAVENHGFTGPSSYITIKNSNLFSVPDISQWSVQDWLDKAASAINSAAAHTIVDKVTMTNVNNGVYFSGEYSEIRNSSITNFGKDGIQFNAKNVKIEYNTIKNSYKISTNHDDLIQSWETSIDPKENIEIRGNFLLWHDDPSNPLASTNCQGIFLGGTNNGYVIENNLVHVPMYHGISISGITNGLIINNTVIGPINLNYYAARPGENNIIRNNFAESINIQTGSGGTEDHNIVNYDKYSHFMDYNQGNYRLLKTSTAINTGSSDFAPLIDINQMTRDSNVDIGAYEYQNLFRADVDGSSRITTTDALLTLRNSLGLSMTGTAWQASVTTGDVNCDGDSNSTDALLILRHSLGLLMDGTGWCE